MDAAKMATIAAVEDADSTSFRVFGAHLGPLKPTLESLGPSAFVAFVENTQYSRVDLGRLANLDLEPTACNLHPPIKITGDRAVL